MWRPLVESFQKKLLAWKSWYLSFGGRVILLNPVLSSLPVFVMSVFLLPKGLISSLDKIRRAFLWGWNDASKKINWVRWEVVSRNRLQGGLGVKDIRKFNLSLLGKWWGRMASGEESLMCRIIKEKYGKERRNWAEWMQKRKNVGSLWWQDLFRIDDLDVSHSGWLMGGFRLVIPQIIFDVCRKGFKCASTWKMDPWLMAIDTTMASSLTLMGGEPLVRAQAIIGINNYGKNKDDC
ncbi:hypothetical protein SLEP1_g35447 [Rubroshorea leprosula]|uniref:Uncharacterized protein n=1 Tax=Rubroshorea leprosula TaxID=152421 RepID=A0AAV5KNB5_9ROSI|nr:hypothetical protein SLEP1_g35447 [Rubroshorea leprosula]